MNIRGRAALVTGGGSRFGEATAHALARAGARVALLDLNLQVARSVAEKIGGIALECDAACADSARAAVAAAREAQGPARILVNCPRVAPGAKCTCTKRAWRSKQFCKGTHASAMDTLNLMRLVAADMVKFTPPTGGERGVIVNTMVSPLEGEGARYSGLPGRALALHRAAAAELGVGGIRVCAISLGLLSKPMPSGFTEQLRTALAAVTPLSSNATTPERYAKRALNVIEGALNGEIIGLDGVALLQVTEPQPGQSPTNSKSK